MKKMGEKIRDIQFIHLAHKELMVELNEGYSAEQGKVIHIQNPDFRYLLSEKEYVLAASLIMRGAVETQYIKSQKMMPRSNCTKENRTDLNQFVLIKSIQERKIDYRIIDICDKLVTIIINPESYDDFVRTIIPMTDKRLWHPHGKENGYVFLYQMHPFELYKKNECYYEIFFEMPCLSLTPRTWMPLDRIIQKSIWKNKSERDGIWYAEDEDIYIYFLTRCVFYYRQFQKKHVAFFDTHSFVVGKKTFAEKLHMVFFGFTNVLVEKLKKREYQTIIEDYFSFDGY